MACHQNIEYGNMGGGGGGGLWDFAMTDIFN